MMDKKFEHYIELNSFIEKEYDHLKKKIHSNGLARITRIFNCCLK